MIDLHLKKTRQKQRLNQYRVLLVICWFAYFVAYIGRLNFAAGMVELIRTGVLDKPSAGLIGTMSFFAYGFGQIVSGIAADRFPSKWMVFCGLLLSSFMNVCMGFSKQWWIMAAVWGFNGFVQSLIWPALLRVIAERIESEKQDWFCVKVNTSTVMGTMVAYLITSAIVASLPQGFIFWVPAGLLALAAFIWLAGISSASCHTPTAIPAVKKQTAQPWRNAMHVFVCTGLITVSFAQVCHGILKEGLIAWIPTYLLEMFQIKSTAAILTTVIIPLINFIGMLLAPHILEKCGQNAHKASAIYFIISFFAICLLPNIGTMHPGITLALFGLATACMCGLNTILIGVYPLRYQKYECVATVAGILNAFVYIGSAISNYGIGAISEAIGWTWVIVFWAGTAILGAVLGIWSYKKKRFEKYESKNF